VLKQRLQKNGICCFSGKHTQGRIKADLCPKHTPTLLPRTFHWHTVKTNTTP